MAGEYHHQPVMADEAMAALSVTATGCYVDATFGRGGHTALLLEQLGSPGRLIVMDRDPQAIQTAQMRYANDRRITIVHGAFSQLSDILADMGLNGEIDGILFDLGVSSPQLDDSLRGFSFRREGPLDMRMNPAAGVSAADWLARAGEAEIATVLRDYGEERYARRIARAIVRARQVRPVTTTFDLAAIVAAASPRREAGKDPATRSFQAIRIHINHELEELRSGLQQALGSLAPGGRLVVISFHSLEDRIVKRFLRREAQGIPLPRRLPVMETERRCHLRLIGRAMRPAVTEVASNPRARSAVMRVAEKQEW